MTARKFLNRLGGFTLVELLIVIAILGVIALIVIAAINPIEQANRARDTGMKADASQLLSASDRYFAARNHFPWVALDPADAYDSDDNSFGYKSVDDVTVGLCSVLATDSCTAGVLVDEQELKPEFLNRRFVGTDKPWVDSMFIGKDFNDQSVYICYTPASRSNRQRACDDGSVYELSLDDNSGATTDLRVDHPCVDATAETWSGSTFADSLYVCVPE